MTGGALFERCMTIRCPSSVRLVEYLDPRPEILVLIGSASYAGAPRVFLPPPVRIVVQQQQDIHAERLEGSHPRPAVRERYAGLVGASDGLSA